jgi:hypothetical protein
MEKQNENFTKKMLSEKVFTCAICENLLMVPVMMVEDVGNVCHKCFRSRNEENGKSLPNTTLNAILQELKLPCKFESEGCEAETKKNVFFAQLNALCQNLIANGRVNW